MKPILVLLLCTSVVLSARSRDEFREKENELNVLRSRLETAGDSLQSLIAERWRKKQEYVGSRETNKDKLARLRDAQERAYLELSRTKEEALAAQRTIEDEREELEKLRAEWDFVSHTLDEQLIKEADAILSSFPPDRENRREKLEEVRRAHSQGKRAEQVLQQSVEYSLAFLRGGMVGEVLKQTLIPDDGGAEDLTLGRFGTVFAYGLNAEGRAFVLRQTGRIGPGRFTLREIGDQSLLEFCRTSFPRWKSVGKPVGNTPTDVLQNAQSAILVSGEEIGLKSKARDFVRAGGPIMVPLLLLPVWALILVFIKLIQLHVRHRANTRLNNRIVNLLEEGKIDAARKRVAGNKDAVSRVVGACLDHSEWDREDAEEAVRDILVEETPSLSSHLNTLAVIAGVAPLLGLLGTVTGMIELFSVITHYGTGDPKIMAGGISEALITTQTGLAVAIPILLFHNYLRNRKNRLQAEMEKSAVAVMNAIWPRKAGKPSASNPPVTHNP